MYNNIFPKAKIEIKTLQILRGIAAASVVYFHIRGITAFGGFGIDIFFVLSGFVIAMIIATGQTASNFVIHRVSRIVPLYWILTTCVFVLAALGPGLLNSTSANFSNYFKSIFFIPYFKENGLLMPILAVGWTLNVEMLFYCCVWMSICISRKNYILITIGLLFFAYLTLGNCIEPGVLRTFFGKVVIFEFIFGMLAYKAYELRFLSNISVKYYLFTALISYIAMLAVDANGVQTFMYIDDVNGIGSSRLLFYGIPCLLLIFSAVNLETLISMIPNPLVNIFVSIGNASYATYLSHLFVVEGFKKIVFSKYNLINPYVPFGALIVLITALIVGQIIYLFVDNPSSRYFKDILTTK